MLSMKLDAEICSDSNGKTEVVYVRFRKQQKVYKTCEVMRDVFVDYNRRGNIIGVEFTEPAGYNQTKMQKLSELVQFPFLRSLDISKM